MNLSERRACSIVGADRKMIRYRSGARQTRLCATGCAILPTSGGVSATGGCLKLLDDALSGARYFARSHVSPTTL